MADLKTKITFVNGKTLFTTNQVYDLVGNREDSTITFKRNKTLWLDGSEYKVVHVEFMVFEREENGITCEALIHILSV
ncbi:hypothetical protein [Flavobacterium suzhouense]|uniref:Uncharacterized protein n=1 Tax=Flavobacterium suzhouense TaxID=1529638 RepID=A0ABW5NVX2_9FLAO